MAKITAKELFSLPFALIIASLKCKITTLREPNRVRGLGNFPVRHVKYTRKVIYTNTSTI